VASFLSEFRRITVIIGRLISEGAERHGIIRINKDILCLLLHGWPYGVLPPSLQVFWLWCLTTETNLLYKVIGIAIVVCCSVPVWLLCNLETQQRHTRRPTASPASPQCPHECAISAALPQKCPHECSTGADYITWQCEYEWTISAPCFTWHCPHECTIGAVSPHNVHTSVPPVLTMYHLTMWIWVNYQRSLFHLTLSTRVHHRRCHLIMSTLVLHQQYLSPDSADTSAPPLLSPNSVQTNAPSLLSPDTCWEHAVA
jgi:hypothetical protein